MSGSALPPDVRRWLCPAHSCHVFSRATPLVRALPFASIGPEAAPRAQPKMQKGTFTAGHSHPLSSGGKAEPQASRYF